MNIFYESEALHNLELLPKLVESRIVKKLEFFAAQEHPLSFAKYLTGLRVYRFRIGEYRVIFDVQTDTIVVLAIGKRDDIYRDL